jgi:hypothetical protein
MENKNIVALVIIFLAGSLLIIASVINWKVLFENRTDNFITRKFGKSAYRWIYALVGILMICTGIYGILTKEL